MYKQDDVLALAQSFRDIVHLSFHDERSLVIIDGNMEVHIFLDRCVHITFPRLQVQG